MKVTWIDSFAARTPEPSAVETPFIGSSPGAKPETVLTIGAFDGVHLGHQYLIREVVDCARAIGAQSMVVTFDPLPIEVIFHASAVRLTDIGERITLLKTLELDHVAVIRFDQAFAGLSADEFIDGLLLRYNLREIVCGADFAFGHKRQGNVAHLLRKGTELGFDVNVVERQNADGGRLASSAIRELVRTGDVSKATEYLGHPPTTSGIVVKGQGRGRDLGFPTANLDVSSARLLPAPGIYAGYALRRSNRYQAAISIGHNPTFGVNPLTVEAHLLDFDDDLVGQRLTLHFADRLRAEENFTSVSGLVEQIQRDVDQTRDLLAPSSG